MGSKVGKILKAVAPLALNFVPGFQGIGTALGSSLLGAGTAGAATLGNAILGAGVGGLTGGGKGALTGALGGAISPNIGNIGSAADGGSGILGAAGRNIPGVYDIASGISDAGSSLSGLFGGGSDSAASGFSGGGSLGSSASFPLQKDFNLQIGQIASPFEGTAAGGGASSFGSGALSGSSFAPSSSSFSSYALPALGALNSLSAQDDALEQLQRAGQQAEGLYAPYTASGAAANAKLSDFLGTSGTPTSTAEILASNPAYQFQLQQGTDALNRKQAASGNYFSGGALQAAQDYGQGLANQTAQDFYSRLAQQSGQGLSAAGGSAGIAGQLGSAGANASIATGNTLSQLLAGAGRSEPYYDAATGTIKYR